MKSAKPSALMRISLFADEVRARSPPQPGGAIDHRDIRLWQAHRDRVFLAFSIRGHG
jgi:hypothetical protein